MLRHPLRLKALARLPFWMAVLLAVPAFGSVRVGLLPLERIGDADPAYDSLASNLHRQVTLLSDAPAVDVALPGGCALADADCVAKAGQSAGAETVLAFSVEPYPGGYALRIRTFPAGGAAPRDITRLIQGSAPALVGAAERLSCEVLKGEHCDGLLKVSGPSSARLILDGKDAGTLPHSSPIPIGHHSLRVKIEAAQSDETSFDISWKQESTFNVTARDQTIAVERAGAPLPMAAVIAPANPDDLPLPTEMLAADTAAPPAATTPPPAAVVPPAAAVVEAPKAVVSATQAAPQRVAFLSAAIGAGVFLAAGAVCGSVSLGTADKLNAKYKDGTLTAADKSDLGVARGTATAANVMYGLSGLGAVTAIVLLITDPRVIGSGGDVGDRPTISIGPAEVSVQGKF